MGCPHLPLDCIYAASRLHLGCRWEGRVSSLGRAPLIYVYPSLDADHDRLLGARALHEAANPSVALGALHLPCARPRSLIIPRAPISPAHRASHPSRPRSPSPSPTSRALVGQVSRSVGAAQPVPLRVRLPPLLALVGAHHNRPARSHLLLRPLLRAHRARLPPRLAPPVARQPERLAARLALLAALPRLRPAPHTHAHGAPSPPRACRARLRARARLTSPRQTARARLQGGTTSSSCRAPARPRRSSSRRCPSSRARSCSRSS